MFINDICNPEVKVTGNTVGKVDRFEPELLSWLLKLAYFYPRYDYEKYKTFDADDFKKWVLQEVGSLVKPYLDCLTAMMAPYPLYQDNLDVSKMENAIKFFINNILKVLVRLSCMLLGKRFFHLMMI